MQDRQNAKRWLKRRRVKPPSQPTTVPTSPTGNPARVAISDRSFFGRVLDALALTEAELVVLLQLAPHEIDALRSVRRGLIVPVDDDEMWSRILQFVNARIGALFAVREELTRKLAADRRERLARRLETENR